MSDIRHACLARLHAARASRHSLAGLFAALTAVILLSLVLVPPALAQQAPGGGPQSANIFNQPSELPDTQAERQVKQPLNNAPVWRAVNSTQSHYTTLPANEGGVLVQTAGEDWRQLRNGPITQWGGWLLVGLLIVIIAFYLIRGTIRLSTPATGRLIERFTVVERLAHWTTAISFVILAISGMLMLFGKHVVLPVFGHSVFSGIAFVSKGLHNFVGPVFSLAIIVTFILFVRDNFPEKGDLGWVKRFGGLFSRNSHVPSGRFNAGEKAWFWGGLTVLGLIMTVTGLILDFPNFQQTRGQMQLAWTWHAIAAVLFICGAMGHIYIGTLGMEGAYKAMRTGVVDEAWAKEHHEYWYDDVKSGRIPARRSGTSTAGGPAASPNSPSEQQPA
jgi:formate dehydrogenase subunit gamma